MVVESELLKNIGKVKNYLASSEHTPLFLEADTYTLLQLFPDNSIDCVITSPPYWGQRAYAKIGIGLESTWEEYTNNLLTIHGEIKRILKPSGSFWLNIGDSYQRKSLIGIPWRIALSMTDNQGWLLRNSVIWNKVNPVMFGISYQKTLKSENFTSQLILKIYVKFPSSLPVPNPVWC